MDNLSGVRLSELRKARHRILPPRRADFLSNEGKSTSRQSIAKLLKSNLSKVGFEFNQFDTVIQQSETEVRQRAASLTAEAEKNFPAVQQDLNRTLVNLVGRINNPKLSQQYTSAADRVRRQNLISTQALEMMEASLSQIIQGR